MDSLAGWFRQYKDYALFRKGLSMKKMLFIMMILAACLTVTVSAADKMGVTVEATYMTKYIWHGFDLYDNKGAFLPSVNIDLGDSGFYTGVQYVSPIGGGNAYGVLPLSDLERWVYWVGYANQAMVGENTQLDYDLSYTYFDLGTVRTGSSFAMLMPGKISGADLDMQELAFAVKMPNICPIGVYPRYKAIYMFEPSGSEWGMWGFEHTFGMGYDFAVADMPMSAGIDFVYDDVEILNDQHDWSRLVAGLSTEIQLGTGKLVPGIYYQKAFDDEATGPMIDDDFYATVSYSIDF